MKEYLKPYIEDEEIEIEDICTVSGGTNSGNVETDGFDIDPSKYW